MNPIAQLLSATNAPVTSTDANPAGHDHADGPSARDGELDFDFAMLATSYLNPLPIEQDLPLVVPEVDPSFGDSEPAAESSFLVDGSAESSVSLSTSAVSLGIVTQQISEAKEPDVAVHAARSPISSPITLPVSEAEPGVRDAPIPAGVTASDAAEVPNQPPAVKEAAATTPPPTTSSQLPAVSNPLLNEDSEIPRTSRDGMEKAVDEKTNDGTSGKTEHVEGTSQPLVNELLVARLTSAYQADDDVGFERSNLNKSPADSPPVDSAAMPTSTVQSAAVAASRLASSSFAESAASPPVVDQLAEAILQRIQRLDEPGGLRFEIQLDPPELGRMIVRLERTLEGLTAQVFVADDSVRQIVEQQLHRLHQAMEDAGLQLDQFDVSQQQRQSNQDADDTRPAPETPVVPENESSRLTSSGTSGKRGRLDVIA